MGLSMTSDMFGEEDFHRFLPSDKGFMDDLERAKAGTHVRAGRGTMRGRRYKSPKSLLLIVEDTEKTRRGFGNLTGVDITTPNQLNPEILAPGGMPGRLTVISEGALKQLEAW